MNKLMDFYFDFSSPYSYMASVQIEALAADIGREVAWHPILLGPMFNVMGSAPLVQIPLKGDYSYRDMRRTAQLFDIPFAVPEPFPISTVKAARAALYLREKDMGLAAQFSKAVFRAYFAEGKDIRDDAVILRLAEQVGADGAATVAATDSQVIKDRLKSDVAAAMERGVFGAPFIMVDDEPFWGFDRFPHIRMWFAQQK